MVTDAIEVDVLDGMDEGSPLLGRPLEGLSAHDESRSPGPLVDDRGTDRLGQVVSPLRLPAGVDQGNPPRITVDHLPPGEIDRMVGGEFAVDQADRSSRTSSAL